MSHENFEVPWSKALYNYKELLFTVAPFYLPLMSAVVSKCIREKKMRGKIKEGYFLPYWDITFVTIYWCYADILKMRPPAVWLPVWEVFVNIPNILDLKAWASSIFLGFLQILHRTHISMNLVDGTQHQNVLTKIFFSYTFFVFHFNESVAVSLICKSTLICQSLSLTHTYTHTHIHTFNLSILSKWDNLNFHLEKPGVKSLFLLENFNYMNINLFSVPFQTVSGMVPLYSLTDWLTPSEPSK